MTDNTVRKAVRNPQIATHETAQKKLPTMLSDVEMEESYMDFPLTGRVGSENHIRGTYEQAQCRRAYRQWHVIKNWDEIDRKILFLLILGWTRKEIASPFGFTRQAVEKRLKIMREQIGIKEDTQLLLWFLGFIALHPDGCKAIPGTTLISSCECEPSFRSLLRSIHQ